MKPQLFHKHLLVRAEVTSPPLKIDNLGLMLKNLVRMIGMKILSGPHTAYCPVQGNEGWSGAVIIETSSITFHSWLETDYPVIQLDVYTCGPLEIKIVLDWLSAFAPSKIDYKYIDREHAFIEILNQQIVLNTLHKQEANA